MTTARRCSRNGCGHPAVATLTFAYDECTAVVGPLGAVGEPHSYDLCAGHAASLTAPQGWEIVRPEEGFDEPEPGPDDLEVLVDAVWDAESSEASAAPEPADPGGGAPRRGHLRVVRSGEQ